MKNVIRIGTRDSELALWQATTVQNKLEALGHNTTLIPVKSTGDLVLDKPLYELGITGIFTKTLDVALIKGDIDIAVHSMKDVPTLLPKGVVKTAVLERAVSHDILVHKGTTFLEKSGTIATGSLRRKAQWLAKYPNHKMVDLRGNVNSRLIKLIQNDWNGAIFAQAGGCTAPIGAAAEIKDQTVHFRGCLHALDGSTSVHVQKERPITNVEGFGKSCAYEILESGGKQLMEEIKNELNNSVH